MWVSKGGKFHFFENFLSTPESLFVYSACGSFVDRKLRIKLEKDKVLKRPRVEDRCKNCLRAK